MTQLTLPAHLLEQCYAHGRSAYPEEGCGVLSGPADDEGALDGAIVGVVDTCHPLANIINQMHEEDPGRYPRTGKNAYFIDPGEMMRLDKALNAKGHKIKAIFHSHVDVGAYFSQEDKDRALWAGQPILPGIGYLVCGIKDGQPDGAVLAYFDDAAGDFLTVPVDSVG